MRFCVSRYYRVEVVHDEAVCLDDALNFGSVVALDCEDEHVYHGVWRVFFPREDPVLGSFFEADLEPLKLSQQHDEFDAHPLFQLYSLLPLDLGHRKLVKQMLPVD